MIKRADLRLIGLEAPDPGPCKLVVTPACGRWRVSDGDHDRGVFASLEDATSAACAVARDAAAGGIVGLVVVQGDPQELHCFTPAGAGRG